MRSKLLDMSKRQWLALIVIILSATIFRIALQAFMPDSGNSPFPPSAIAQAGLIPLAFAIFGLLTYGQLAIAFILIQGGLKGRAMRKGLTFGLLFGMMWAVYLLEPLPHGLGIPFIKTISYPFVDGITIVLLGAQLGRFAASDSLGSEKVCKSSGIMALAIFPVLFLAGRLLSYNVFHIYSSFAARPFDTMLWAAVTGLWIGIMYLLLRPGMAAKSPSARAASFGLLIYGIAYLLFSLFLTLVFDYQIWPVGELLSYADLSIRTVMDIASVTSGVFVYEMSLSRIRNQAPAVI